MENIIGDACGHQHRPNAASYSEPQCKHREILNFAGNEQPQAGVKAAVASNAAQDPRADFTLALIRENQQLKTKLDLYKRTERRLQAAVKIARAEYGPTALLLRNLSHELRTQLNTIIGFSDIIQSELSGPAGIPKYADYARHINQSGMHLLRLMSNMLDVAQLEAGALPVNEEPFDLAECLTSSMRGVERQAHTPRAVLLLEIADDLPPMRGDWARIRQIFTNLMCNAIKLTPVEGKVQVSAAKSDEGGIQIEILGSVIYPSPDDLQEKLLPLEQAVNNLSLTYEGYGLELTIAKLLTERHDGVLCIDSGPGNGARVTVRFPASRIVNVETAVDRTCA